MRARRSQFKSDVPAVGLPRPLHSRKPGLLTSVPSPRSLRAVSLRELEQTVSSINWPRVVASGALWTMVYNFVWGAAWFAFMRREWIDAMAAIERPMPFTAGGWFLVVVLSLPT